MISRLKLSMIAVLLLSTLTAWPTFGQGVTLPRAAAPQLLFGFEGANGIRDWTGLACSITTEHASEGTQGMSLTFPKWEPGADKWPLVSINWNNGQGYPVKDWSHYAKLSFDAWIDCDIPSEVAIELRSTANKNGASGKYLLQPKVKNTIEITLSDMNRDVDLNNVQQVTFWASVPSHKFTVTIDNVRLLPGDKYPLADFDLVYPNYRSMIFPTAKKVTVGIQLHPEEYNVSPKDLALVLQASSGKTTVQTKSRLSANKATIAVPVQKFRPGTVKLTSTIVKTSTGETMATKTWMLRKITKTEVASTKVYIDENDNTIVDGKPYFPLGWYGNGTEQQMNEVADSPFNCLLDYGTTNKSKDQMRQYLDKVSAKGLKFIYCMNDLYPTATYFKDKSWEGLTGNEQIAAAMVAAYKDHPAMLSWYLNDERPKSVVPQMKAYYKSVAGRDSNHPCYIVLCNMPEVKYFSDTTDIIGVDPYPIPSSPVTVISEDAEIANSAVNNHKPHWMVLQAFAWYQHNSLNPDRAHIPTAKELEEGRAPTYEESRCMTYLALTHGAKGLLYWCYYDMRWLPQYQEMWGWMKTIGAEVKQLSPMLLSPKDFGTVRYESSSANIHTKLKAHNGRLYLMAVNADNAPCKATFDTARSLSGKASVMFEHRTINTDGKRFTDSFKPLEVHVYDLGQIIRH